MPICIKRSLVHCCLDGFVTRMKCKLDSVKGEDTQQLFTHLDAGALVWVGHQNTLFRVSHTGALVDTRGLSMCDTLQKKVSIPAKGKKSCLQLGTLPKQTIGRHFQAMFHIPISCLRYLCAKYTFFLFTLGRKELGHLRTPRTPHLMKKGNSPHTIKKMWREERFMNWVK
ncbi:hypothetical protein AB205_0200210 [Aquarana catesbeiana]|uniref:Uncharacterized protein n=1 Tax=Aquarana catesbeiana TaxID=8400 RepID=A0A2G9RGB5_AQUCT|nr:hypothetical protein AB205_0200210 [Aquarana catesbeiana]